MLPPPPRHEAPLDLLEVVAAAQHHDRHGVVGVTDRVHGAPTLPFAMDGVDDHWSLLPASRAWVSRRPISAYAASRAAS